MVLPDRKRIACKRGCAHPNEKIAIVFKENRFLLSPMKAITRLHRKLVPHGGFPLQILAQKNVNISMIKRRENTKKTCINFHVYVVIPNPREGFQDQGNSN